MTARILAIGDVSGQIGLNFLSDHLRSLQKLQAIDFTVVNGENASGVGITPRQAEEIFDAGADVITLGNHTWGRREICNYLDDEPRILRPANYAPQVPGRGWGLYDASFGSVLVLNLIGRCGMVFGPDNPFFAADKILKEHPAAVSLIDMHAEATSEKLALAHYLDGRVSAVWGTHTHVQTSDAQVLRGGTGFLCDLGMTGAADSVIGIKKEQSISNFLGNPPQRYEQAGGAGKMEGAIFTIDPQSGKTISVEAVRIQ